MSLYSSLWQFALSRFERWVVRRLPPVRSIVLNRNNIFILPTTQGLIYILAAVLIFVAAINYGISLAFGLAFLMISIFIVSILHTFRNLQGLTLSAMSSQPVFEGEEIGYRIMLAREPGRLNDSLQLYFSSMTLTHVNLVTTSQFEANVYLRGASRGYCEAPRLTIKTYFPLGLCRAWSNIDLNMRALVYPKPIACQMDQFANSAQGGDTLVNSPGGEDFYGLRTYSAGDPLKHIAWKNYARGQGLKVKQFVDTADNKIWLDWDMFHSFSTEERLSRLCFCVLRLSKNKCDYGLRMPDVSVSPASGQKHKLKLLEILALYRSPSVNSISD